MEKNEKPEFPKQDIDYHSRIHHIGDRIGSIRGSIEKNDTTIKDEAVSPPPAPTKKDK